VALYGRMTAQIPDTLLIDGKCHPVYISNTETPLLPPSSRILHIDSALPNNSACWRGYQALWEIKNGALYLKDLSGMYNISDGESILADHFTGVLRVPKGKLLHYDNMGFSSVFSEELHISVRDGEILDIRLISNPEEKCQLEKPAGIRKTPAIIRFVIQSINVLNNLCRPFKR